MKEINRYSVIGLMSGTSLDGLDIAFCHFSFDGSRWRFRIQKAVTVPYPDEWKARLSGIENGTAFDLALTDVEYGHYTGRLVKSFMTEFSLKPDFIASHGHTIFHQPEKHMTLQIGKGSAIAAETGVPVICDFRSADVAIGGQGAPLVPIGDRLLFGEYDYCLNLGGFSNISFEENGRRVAFDVSPCNIVLNRLAGHFNIPYDKNGSLSSEGKTDPALLDELNRLPFYSASHPKSLGKEWVLREFLPILEHSSVPVKDKMRTVTGHIAQQVANAIKNGSGRKMLVTGGGAFNGFLIERIRGIASVEVILPDDDTINFKEALVFAFLGVLRWRNEMNCLCSYTGASRDSSGGMICQ